jgi:hypothetical protein
MGRGEHYKHGYLKTSQYTYGTAVKTIWERLLSNSDQKLNHFHMQSTDSSLCSGVSPCVYLHALDYIQHDRLAASSVTVY